jgi:hypothetical protein
MGQAPAYRTGENVTSAVTPPAAGAIAGHIGDTELKRFAVSDGGAEDAAVGGLDDRRQAVALPGRR